MSEARLTYRLLAAIFDVDGVLVASPHERAWRESLVGYADPARFTTKFYQSVVAGKPRLDGARATLEGLGVPGVIHPIGQDDHDAAFGSAVLQAFDAQRYAFANGGAVFFRYGDDFNLLEQGEQGVMV